MLISLSNISIRLEMANFLFSAYFGSHFCYHSNVKVKIIPDFYTLAFVLINLQEEIGEEIRVYSVCL